MATKGFNISAGSPLNPSDSQWPVFFALVVVAFAVYGNTFFNGWTYDDFPVIVENPQIQSLAEFLSQSFWPGGSRVMRELTYLVDYQFFQLQPTGYHVQNILWHAVNGCLLFVLARSFGVAKVASALAALLFLIHPLQVEVVANTSHRKDSLVLCFSLLSLYAFRRSYLPQGKRLLWLSASFVAFVLALYAKQSALALPLVMVAYELSLPGRERLIFKKAWSWFFPAAGVFLLIVKWVISGGLSSFFVAAQGHLSRQNFYSQDFWEVTQAHFMMVLKSWLLMWSKLLWPTNLAVEYTPGVPQSWLDPWIVGCLVLLTVYAWAIVWSWKNKKTDLVFGLLATGLAWLPTSNIYPFSYYAADRYLYMPSIGFYLLLATLLTKLILKQRMSGYGLTLVVCGVMVALTVQQNRVWHSPESLWSQALKVSPRSAYALNNVGMVHFQKQDMQTAYEYFLRAAETDPFNPTSQFNLGFMNERFGFPEKALKYYRNFLMLKDPQFRSQREQLRQRLKRQYGVDLDQ